MQRSFAAVIFIGLTSLSGLYGANFAVVSQSAIYDATTGLVAFRISFNQPPDFFTADTVGRRANSFQYYIAGEPAVPGQDPDANLDTVISGGEIYLGHGIPIRSAFPPSKDSTSGGWGAVRATVPFTLAGTDLTFSAPLTILSDHSTDGNFTYRLSTFVYGGERQVLNAQSVVCPPCSSGPSQWSNHGGVQISNVVNARDTNDLLEVFGLGVDHQMWHIVQGFDGSWGTWTQLSASPVPLTGDPAVGLSADGLIQLFVTADDGTLWALSQITLGNWFFSKWVNIATGVKGRVAVANDANGDLQVFAWKTGGDLGWIRPNPTPPGWLPMTSLGGVISSNPAAALDSNGLLQVVATGTDQALWNIGITATRGIAAWNSLGGSWKNDPVIVHRPGVFDVLVHGVDDSLWYQSNGSSGWAGWNGLGGQIVGNPAAMFNGDGRLEAFAIGTDRALWHTSQTSAGGAQWTNWSSLGGYLSGGSISPRLGLDAIGNVFAVGSDLGLWEISQTSPGLWQ